MIQKSGTGAFLSVVFILALLLVPVVAAAEVAYIYKNQPKIDQNIVDVFEELGFTVDFISETQLPSDFSQYDLLFVGDERYRNELSIPVGDIPTIVTNYFFGEEWGLTDFDGISKLASNHPLKVQKTGQIVQVYTRSSYPNKDFEIPYYYLADENKLSHTQGIARTFIGMYTFESYGDVISYVPAGAQLLNGHVSQGNVCFFGIVESEFWTPEAREMFKDCVGFASIACHQDTDCGDDGFVDRPFCIVDDVYQKYKEYTCENPGEIGSRCVLDTSHVLKEQCSDTCTSGKCVDVPECSDGKDNDFDGKIDYPADLGCDSPNDDDESNDPECSDRIDNDHDGKIDYPHDPGCDSPSDNDERDTPECRDGKDNDNDGKIDYPADLGCDSPNDDDESNDPECSDGKDNDNDGKIDYPQDPGCDSPGDNDERDKPQCSDGRDNDNDGKIDYPQDPGCDSPNDPDERDPFCRVDADCDDGSAYTIDECVRPGHVDSFCRNTPVNCVTNSDCGFTGFSGTEFCSANDVYKTHQTAVCHNGGTLQSYCEVSASSQQLTTCGTDSCGQFGNTFCKAGDVYKDRACYAAGCSDGGCYNNAFTDEKLVEECQYGCSAGACLPPNVACSHDSQCGTNGFIGGEYCTNDDVYRDFKTHTCKNPGTVGSFCTQKVEPKLIEQCSDTCTDGTCVEIECYTETDCGVDGFVGGEYCSYDDVYRDYKDFTCKKPGTAQSFCTQKVEPRLIELCTDTCVSGSCVDLPECSDGRDNDNDGKIDYPQDPGCDSPNDPDEEGECRTDSQCGVDTYSNDYCYNDDVYRDKNDNYCNQHVEMCMVDTTKQKVEECGGDYCEDYLELVCIGDSVYSAQTCYAQGCSDGSCFTNEFTDTQFIERCEFGCGDGYCLPPPVECYTETDCGVDGFVGGEYCSYDDVYRDFKDYTCKKPGTAQSFCTQKVEPKLIEQCSDTCVNGSCVPIECYEDADCGIGGSVGKEYCVQTDVYEDVKTYTCKKPGTPQSFCTSKVTTHLVEQCSFSCGDGMCEGECRTDSQCGVDTYSNDYCYNDDVYRDKNDNYCNQHVEMCMVDTTKQKVEECGGDYCEDFIELVCIYGDVYSTQTCYAQGCSDGSCFSDSYVDKNLVEECEFGCGDGYCLPPPVECTKDRDCGTDRYVGGEYCSYDDVYRDFETFTCKKPGTPQSYCVSDVNPKLIEQCSDTCTDGTCVEIECYKDRDCGVDGFVGGEYCSYDDVYRDYKDFTCKKPGTVQSFCTQKVEPKLIEMCSDECVNGMCKEKEKCEDDDRDDDDRDKDDDREDDDDDDRDDDKKKKRNYWWYGSGQNTYYYSGYGGDRDDDRDKDDDDDRDDDNDRGDECKEDDDRDDRDKDDDREDDDDDDDRKKKDKDRDDD